MLWCALWKQLLYTYTDTDRWSGIKRTEQLLELEVSCKSSMFRSKTKIVWSTLASHHTVIWLFLQWLRGKWLPPSFQLLVMFSTKFGRMLAGTQTKINSHAGFRCDPFLRVPEFLQWTNTHPMKHQQLLFICEKSLLFCVQTFRKGLPLVAKIGATPQHPGPCHPSLDGWICIYRCSVNIICTNNI